MTKHREAEARGKGAQLAANLRHLVARERVTKHGFTILLRGCRHRGMGGRAKGLDNAALLLGVPWPRN